MLGSKTVIFAVLAFLFIAEFHLGESLKCIVCSSWEDEKCVSAPDTLEAEQCFATSPTVPTTAGTSSTKPTSAGTGSTDPTTVRTDSTEATTAGTDSTEATTSGTDSTEPTSSGTDTTEATTSGTDSTEPTSSGTDTTESSKLPTPSTPESSSPNASTPESSSPSASTPESSSPNASTPESSSPSASTPESSLPVTTTEEPITENAEATPITIDQANSAGPLVPGPANEKELTGAASRLRFIRSFARAEEATGCYKLVYKKDDKEVVERGCIKSSGTCNSLQADKKDAKCYSCSDKDGCNSSSMIAHSLTSVLLLLGVTFYLNR